MNTAIINHGNDILTAIVSTCLWNEPHQLDEILEKLEQLFPLDDGSRDGFLKCTSIVLGEAVKAGLIRKRAGFFVLTPEGRKSVEVDRNSVIYHIYSSLPHYC